MRQSLIQRLEVNNYTLLSQSLDECMQKTVLMIEKVAPRDCPVVVFGETGVGKQLVAKAIHEKSKISDKRFVHVDCTHQNKELTESNLFGHVRGAFTGAYTDKLGFFEAAYSGTVFLDEIGELPLDLQPKLLRVLEDGTFNKLGSTDEVTTDCRVIAATNRDLRKMVEAGTFREDLYYRLEVFSIPVPPLRERKRDIVRFAREFTALFSEDKMSLEKNCEVSLQTHSWPGNIRELRNLIERSVAWAEEGKAVLTSDCLRFANPAGAESLTDRLVSSVEALIGKSPYWDIVDLTEKTLVTRALQITGGNQTEACTMLQIDPSILYRRMKKWGMR